MAGVLLETGTAYHSPAPGFTSGFWWVHVAHLFSFFCCVFFYLHVLCSQYCQTVFVLFVFILCFVFPILPGGFCFVCLHPVFCVPNIARWFLFCLSSSCVLCSQYCQVVFVLFVFILCFVFPILPDGFCFVCLHPVFCVPNIARWFLFCLSSSCVLCSQYCQMVFVLFVFILCFVFPILPGGFCFVCLHPVFCVPNIARWFLFCLSSSCVLCSQYCQVVFVLFVFILCFVIPILSGGFCFVCLHPVFCVPNIARWFLFCLSSSCVLCSQYCQVVFVLFVFILCFVIPILSGGFCFVCLHPVFCVPNIVRWFLFCLSSSCVLCSQ